MNCHNKTLEQLNRVKYLSSDLVRFFNEFNECSGGPKSIGDEPKREIFRLSVKAGLNFSRLSVAHTDPLVMPEFDFPSKTVFTGGLEGEFIFPFNKNKWSLPVEMLYQQYAAEEQVEPKGEISVAYRELQFALGLKHHVFLKNDARLFFQGLISYSRCDKEYSKLYLVNRSLDLSTGLGASLGAGVAWGRVSAELRYNLPKSVLTGYMLWKGKYHVVSAIVGFRLFRAHST